MKARHSAVLALLIPALGSNPKPALAADPNPSSYDPGKYTVIYGPMGMQIPIPILSPEEEAANIATEQASADAAKLQAESAKQEEEALAAKEPEAVQPKEPTASGPNPGAALSTADQAADAVVGALGPDLGLTGAQAPSSGDNAGTGIPAGTAVEALPAAAPPSADGSLFAPAVNTFPSLTKGSIRINGTARGIMRGLSDNAQKPENNAVPAASPASGRPSP